MCLESIQLLLCFCSTSEPEVLPQFLLPLLSLLVLKLVDFNAQIMTLFHDIAVGYRVSVIMYLIFFNQRGTSLSSADFGIIE